MDDFPFLISPFLIPIAAIVGGITVAIVSTIAKGRVRELEIRERIAMIERGMVPPPEADPAGFERSLRSVEGMQYRHSGPRHRSAGIIVMSLGFGLMLLISLTSGSVDIGVGVGGFLVILGLGFFLVSLMAAPPPPNFPPNLPGPDYRPSSGPGANPSGPADLR
jgi:hypothetical protein